VHGNVAYAVPRLLRLACAPRRLMYGTYLYTATGFAMSVSSMAVCQLDVLKGSCDHGHLVVLVPSCSMALTSIGTGHAITPSVTPLLCCTATILLDGVQVAAMKRAQYIKLCVDTVALPVR
jgi:hypothetical protein